MRKGKLVILAIFTLSLALFLSGCGSTGPTNQSPNADFSASPTSGEAPLEVSFDASGSSDPDGSIISYDWNFGDGSSGSGKTVTHTYDNEGSYQMVLTVRDDGGLSNSESITISVGEDTSITNQPPTARFKLYEIQQSPNRKYQFDASSSSDQDGAIVNYNWQIERHCNSDYSFQESGETFVFRPASYGSSCNFDITLEVTDDDGATDTKVQTESDPI